MWELGLGHVCAEHPERQEGRMVCIRTVSCRHVFFIFLWERNGLGAVMVSGERLGERGRKKGRKERTGRGSLNDVSAKTKICMERKQDLR